MNYTKIYNRLIERSINRNIIDYVENHHIVPRCMGGTDDSSNFAVLTAREHYVAHLCLVKMYPSNNSLIKAAVMMTCNSSNHSRSGNRIYEWLRKHHSKAMSESQSGSGNSQFGMMWIYNLTTKTSKKISKSDNIPDGWIPGRKIYFEIKKCILCDKEVPTKFSSYCHEHKKIVVSNRGKENYKHLKGKTAEAYRGKKFITDGNVDKLHLANLELPDGWSWGRSNNRHKRE